MLCTVKTKHPTSRNQQDLKRVGECLHRSQSSNIYYAIFKKGGSRIKRSLTTTDEDIENQSVQNYGLFINNEHARAYSEEV